MEAGGGSGSGSGEKDRRDHFGEGSWTVVERRNGGWVRMNE
jgi:hypothetical protein